jgi:flagellar hook-associated protein 2
MGLPPLSFTGFSKFSDSFQEILQRTFDAGSIPIQRLKTEQDLLTERHKQLDTLSSTFASLDQAVRALGVASGDGALKGTSTNESVAIATVTGLPEKVSFDLDVTSAASKAQESSIDSLASRTSGSLSTQGDGQFTLTVGGTVTNIGLQTLGAGRTAGLTGAATPSPPVSVQVDFSNGLSGSITAELNSFVVGAAAPSNITLGDTIALDFVSEDLSINESIATTPLTGLEDANAIATLLNAQIALNPQLNGKVSFSDVGGKLKLTESDTVGQGFQFTDSSTGGALSGLQPGGIVGGHSAEEIAAALNAQVALDPALVGAGVTFSAVNGEVNVTGGEAFDFSVTDNAQGTGFVSGLAGAHSAGYPDTLQGLQDYLNANSATLGVKAAIVNTSSDAQNPAYRLTLTANSTGATTLRLQDSAAGDLLTSTNQGTNAVFEVNGVAVSNASNTITDFVPGLDVTIVGPGQATISTQTDASGVSDGLANFVEAYNAAVAVVQSQVGKNAGVLSGSVEIREAQQTLRKITSYFSAEGLHSLREVGLDLQKDGQLEFKPFTFALLGSDELQGALQYLGDLGSGFVGNATTLVNNLTSPTSGQIQTAIDFLEESDSKLSDKITEAQVRLDRIITNLEKRFSAADLLLTQLQSQQEALTAFLDAQKDANKN